MGELRGHFGEKILGTLGKGDGLCCRAVRAEPGRSVSSKPSQEHDVGLHTLSLKNASRRPSVLSTKNIGEAGSHPLVVRIQNGKVVKLPSNFKSHLHVSGSSKSVAGGQLLFKTNGPRPNVSKKRNNILKKIPILKSSRQQLAYVGSKHLKKYPCVELNGFANVSMDSLPTRFGGKSVQNPLVSLEEMIKSSRTAEPDAELGTESHSLLNCFSAEESSACEEVLKYRNFKIFKMLSLIYIYYYDFFLSKYGSYYNLWLTLEVTGCF